jgi:lysophospholipase L1-like esterase
MNIHFIGDSITQAMGHPESGRWTVRLQMLLEDLQPNTYHVYTNGVAGDTSAMGLERMKVPERDTGLTVIEFGFNDAACRAFSRRSRVGIEEFKANLYTFGEIVSQRGGQPVYMIIHPVHILNEVKQTDGEFYSVKCAAYGEACRAVATALRAPIIDVGKRMQEQKIAASDFYSDSVHLSARGNVLLAKMVFTSLLPLLHLKK